MITIYTTDSAGVYAGAIDVSKFSAIPPGSSLTPPPDAPIVQLQGSTWVVLDAYPEPAPAPPVVPAEVTMRQARLALLGAGLLGQVNAALAAMPGAQGEAARIEWEFSSAVQRGQPLVAALAPILGMTDADLDQLFIAAGAL